jgi:hypothetical protein
LPRSPPRTPSAEAEFHPAAAQQVEARGAARENDRLAQRQVDHVRSQPDLGRGGREVGKQRPGIEKVREVRVILDRDHVERGLF